MHNLFLTIIIAYPLIVLVALFTDYLQERIKGALYDFYIANLSLSLILLLGWCIIINF